ncbi:hypothetical protein LJR164_003242 [Phenylobacterium sp. LjRoot164]|uniref:hypothetical protein n=1 Tax=unclassified Phenylobacterium TaxID=2640670 RepID=UPI003ECFA0BE
MKLAAAALAALFVCLAQPAAADDGFKPLGVWAARIDKVETPSQDRLVHVYVTLRNISDKPLVQTERVALLMEDSLGVTVESGQGLQPIAGYPKLFDSPPPMTPPGGEIAAKYVFDRNKDARVVAIMVEESREHLATFTF